MAVTEFKASFPIITDDPIAQFLIEEAVLGNYKLDKIAAQTEETKRQEDQVKLQNEANDLLAAHRRQQGFI